MTITAKPETQGQHQRVSIRPILARLHTVAGILIAPLIFVAAATGFAYALAPTIEQWVYHDQIHTTAPADAPRVSVEKQVRAAQAAAGDKQLSGVQLYDQADVNTRVLFADPSLPEGVSWVVFVDPYTTEIHGQMEQYGSSSSLPLRQWLAHGHKDLWLGTPGRIYAELAASWLGFFALSGVVLWWKLQRKSKGRAASMLRMQRRVDGSRRGYLRQHGAIGTIVAAGMIFLCITGLTWSLVAGENIGKVRKDLGWATPKTSAVLQQDARATASDPLASIDTVDGAAEASLRLPVKLQPPKSADEGWVATEVRQPYRLSNDAAVIDADGQVVAWNRFSEWPLAAKATAWLIQLHMGTLLGLPNQIALALLALGILVVVLRGFNMWKARGYGRAPAVKTLAPLTSKAGIALIVAVLAYSVIAPLFGLSIVVVLVIDQIPARVRAPKEHSQR